MRKYFHILVSIALAFASCDRPDSHPVTEPSVEPGMTVLTSRSGSMFITVDVPGEWTVSLDFGRETPWAELGVTAGEGKRVDVDMYYDENTGDSSRSLRLVVTHQMGMVSCTITQYSTTASDVVCDWMELPEVNIGADQHFFTHFQHMGKSIRSWSYLWDENHLVAHWVAYPLNRSLIGSGSRTDEWGLDPKLPREKQPVLFETFRGGYQRGHQIPSADRYDYEANVQTFYGTNMTPQKGNLNGGVWADLETRVREWSYKFDTLYVVTGCTVKGSKDKAYDNDNKAVTVPSGYFKALLGYTKGGGLGIAPQTGGYTGVAFYLDHFSYPSDYMEAAMTIDQLESKTGFDFFVNLPHKITPTLANRVEATRDNFWWNK